VGFVALTSIAMGGYTPLYRVVYYLVPGISYIRAPSKFLFFASVFAAALAALGAQTLLGESSGRSRANRRTAAVAITLAGGVAIVLGWVSALPVTDPASLLQILERFRSEGDFIVQGDFADWLRIMKSGLVIATASLVGFGALFLFADRARWCSLLIVVLAIAELLLFARAYRGSTNLTFDRDRRQSVIEAYRRAGSDRVLETALPGNVAMARRNYALWGYDPVILQRYVRFMGFTQDIDTRLMRYPTLLRPSTFHPLHSMLRGRIEVQWKTHEIIEHPGAHPRFMLLEDYVVVDGEEASLEALAAPGFDPRRTVILETAPDPAPETATGGGAPGRLWVLDQSTDHIDIEAQLSRAAILVVGDTYSSGWHALPLDGSAQDEYQLLAANHVLRAVPLGRGHHRLRIEYAPTAHRIGGLVSIVSLAGYGTAVLWWCVLRARRIRRVRRPIASTALG
jgi:hypothetical protein